MEGPSNIFLGSMHLFSNTSVSIDVKTAMKFYKRNEGLDEQKQVKVKQIEKGIQSFTIALPLFLFQQRNGIQSV